MRPLLRRICTAVIAGALCAPAAAAPPAPLLNGGGDYRPAWASRLLGQPVIDGDGSHVGLLQEVVVDLATGAARHALISDARRPPALEHYPVPLPRLRATDQGLFLEGAHLYAARALPQSPTAVRMSRLIGMPVDDVEGRRAGHVIDVVLDLGSGTLDHLVMRFHHPRIGTVGDHAFAVPLNALARRTPIAERLVLAVRRDSLTRLVGTDGDRAPHDALRYLGRVDLSPERKPIDVPDALFAVR